MLTRLDAPDEIAKTAELRREIAAGSADLNPSWIDRYGVTIVALESGRHLEPDQIRPLARALRRAGVSRLFAIENDPLVVEDVAYALDATESDLAEFEEECQPVNVLLVPCQRRDLCLLFTKDDFKMIAGPAEFVREVVGDIAQTWSDFFEFSAAFPDNLALQRAASYGRTER